MQKQKVTWAPLVPPIILFLAKHPVVSKFDLSALRLVFSGAAPLDAALTQAVGSFELCHQRTDQFVGCSPFPTCQLQTRIRNDGAVTCQPHDDECEDRVQ